MATILNREATIRTAVVEIKSLTVSGKQVTLALFRQLQEARLIDEHSLELRGAPWGRVNYHFGDCEVVGPHLHIVWQQDDELRRAAVYEDGGNGLALPHHRSAACWKWAALAARARCEEPTVQGKPVSQLAQWERDYPDLTLPASAGGGQEIRLVRPDFLVVRKIADCWRTSQPPYEHWWTNLIALLVAERWLWEGWERYDPDECLAYSEAERARALEIESQWELLYKDLLRLDQLFIAV